MTTTLIAPCELDCAQCDASNTVCNCGISSQKNLSQRFCCIIFLSHNKGER